MRIPRCVPGRERIGCSDYKITFFGGNRVPPQPFDDRDARTSGCNELWTRPPDKKNCRSGQEPCETIQEHTGQTATFDELIRRRNVSSGPSRNQNQHAQGQDDSQQTRSWRPKRDLIAAQAAHLKAIQKRTHSANRRDFPSVFRSPFAASAALDPSCQSGDGLAPSLVA